MYCKNIANQLLVGMSFSRVLSTFSNLICLCEKAKKLSIPKGCECGQILLKSYLYKSKDFDLLKFSFKRVSKQN